MRGWPISWLNGKWLGSRTAPFRLDVTAAIRPGRNRLTVRIANLWVNRLIGDAQPGATHKFSFTTIPTYRADALRASGLLGIHTRVSRSLTVHRST